MSGANLRLFLALAEAERRADDWEYTAKDCAAQLSHALKDERKRAERAEENARFWEGIVQSRNTDILLLERRSEAAEARILEADAFLADPAGNPLDAINLARGALSGASEEGEE